MELTADRELINSVLRDPDIAPGFFREMGREFELPDRFMVLSGEPGLVVLEPIPELEFIGIHLAIRPKHRPAVEFIRSGIRYALTLQPTVRARVQNDRREVQHLAAAVGMTRYNQTSTHTFYEIRR